MVDALGPLLSPGRRDKIEAVLARRLAGLTVVIESLHDPHNGAAAIRSLEAFGLTTLHVVETTEPFRFSSAVTQGCEKWVAIRRHRSFAEAAEALRAEDFALAAAVPGAGRTLAELDVSRPLALVFGNEHAGLSGEAQAGCDLAFGIPLLGMTRSLNLSVSVALGVFEAARRRREVVGEGDLPEARRLELRARSYALSLDDRGAEQLVERWVRERVSR